MESIHESILEMNPSELSNPNFQKDMQLKNVVLITLSASEDYEWFLVDGLL